VLRGGGLSFRSVTRTCSLTGRLSWPFPGFWAKAPTETMPSIITTNKSLSNLFIPSLCLLMAYSRAWEGERDAPLRNCARQMPFTGGVKPVSLTTEFTKKPYFVARFRIYSHLMVQPGTPGVVGKNRLFPHCNTQSANVPARVKHSQRNGVLP
jgi:hypothetical protein